jgi:hypothetical protein
MKRFTAIVLCLFITTWSVASSAYPLVSVETQISAADDGNSTGNPGNDDTHPCEGQPFKTPAPDGEEESEDKDETSNEKVLQRVTISTLTSFLEELYSIQLLVFDEHQPEVATPPPRF